MKDKPSKKPDYYHSCYSLAGLQVAQHKSDYENLYGSEKGWSFDGVYGTISDKFVDWGNFPESKLRKIHPVFGVRFDLLHKAKTYFKNK